ncbi:MAG: OsmC family protein [bacterium]|nr:OsmC family protein [bacterium]
MAREHHYGVTVEWTGNTGTGTSSYQAYERQHEITVAGKPPISGSSDPNFRGDAQRYNPEEMLVASLSACHMLWYLHLCSEAKIVVVGYVDRAEGVMAETAGGGGRFERVTLYPQVRLQAGADVELARRLHHSAHARCFIANSVNFPVACEPTILTA